VIQLDSKTEQLLKKMIDASEEQRIEMARKRTEEMIELPEDQLVKQIENTLLTFSKLNDKDLKVAVKAIILTLEELPPEKKRKFLSARAKAGFSVPTALNDKVLKAGVDATKEISEESYQLFKDQFIKAYIEHNVPIPEFIA
jgi:heterodisulfide reductase subunit A-like polyferredoxin